MPMQHPTARRVVQMPTHGVMQMAHHPGHSALHAPYRPGMCKSASLGRQLSLSPPPMPHPPRSQSTTGLHPSTSHPSTSSSVAVEPVVTTAPVLKSPPTPIVVPVQVVERGRSVDDDQKTELSGTYLMIPPHDQLRELSEMRERQAKNDERLTGKEKRLQEKEQRLEEKEKLLNEQQCHCDRQKAEIEELRRENVELQSKGVERVTAASNDRGDLEAGFKAEINQIKTENDRLRKSETTQDHNIQNSQQQVHELEIGRDDLRRELHKFEADARKHRLDMNEVEGRLRDRETRLQDNELMIESLRHAEVTSEAKLQNLVNSESICELECQSLLREQRQIELLVSELRIQESTSENEIQTQKEAHQMMQAALREKTQVIEDQRNRLGAQQDVINDFKKVNLPKLSPKDWPRGTTCEKLTNARIQYAKVEADLRDAQVRIQELESKLSNRESHLTDDRSA